MRRSMRERFEAKVDRSGGPDACHLWTGARSGGGYGSFGVATNATDGAHRVAYEMANGPIPDGLHVCHRCDVRRCVNPNHLFLGTHDDNVADKERVIAIRLRLAHGERVAIIARDEGVVPGAIYNIKAGRTWRHLDAAAARLSGNGSSAATTGGTR